MTVSDFAMGNWPSSQRNALSIPTEAPTSGNATEATSPGSTRQRRPLQAPDPSDAELAAAVGRGDGSVARYLYARLRPSIEYALLRILRHRHADLEDLIQVTFERVVRSLTANRFSGHSALTTWAAAIAGYVAIDFLRRSQVERRLFSDAAPVDTEAASSAVYFAERRIEARSEMQHLHSVLSKMKPKLAETLVLHDVLGHSAEEVAELSGASVVAVRSRLFRARKDLVRRVGVKDT